MIPSNDIYKAVTMAQKISEQMVVYDKISNSIKSALSLSEKTTSITKLSKIFVSTPKFYLGGEVCSNKCVENLNLSHKIPKDIKFYGGGSWEPVIPKPFLNHNDIKDKSANIDLVFSKDKKSSWFNALDFIKTNSAIAKLDSIDTIRRVSERNLRDSLKSRDSIADGISNLLFLSDGSVRKSTVIESSRLAQYDSCLNNISDLCNSLVDFFVEIINHQEKINYELDKLKILNKLYKSIKIGFKKFFINKREIFRKINSFHFKNLDDYHSTQLA